MKRKIIKIDEEKCTGCGICATACHEGAIEIINGKAKLVRENFCDGFGDCLPGCPVGAITFEEREAPAYDEAAVLAAKAQKACDDAHACPGAEAQEVPYYTTGSFLQNWPPQIQLAPVKSDYYDGADLLIAADCTAYAYGNTHQAFMKNHVTLIGCPKLDPVNYAAKLADIFASNEIRSIHLLRMEVPCCGGMQRAITMALSLSGKKIPFTTTIVTIDGSIQE